MEQDVYQTIAVPSQGGLRELGSRFLGFAHPVSSEEEVRFLLDDLRRQYHDATHVCYAWRLGVGDGERTRSNDDGEPSGTAGRPILGQILSRDLTDVAVFVVRWFGGTKLGVPGLIAAYKGAAAEVLDAAEKVEKMVEEGFEIEFPYIAMNDVMRVVKEFLPRVVEQTFDNECSIRLSIRRSAAENMESRLLKINGVCVRRI